MIIFTAYESAVKFKVWWLHQTIKKLLLYKINVLIIQCLIIQFNENNILIDANPTFKKKIKSPYFSMLFQQESNNIQIIMPSIRHFTFTYPIEERQRLKDLLHEWKMEFFYETFIGNKF